MALSKIITLPSLIDVGHWEVAHIGLNPLENTVIIDYYGYKDSAAFEAGADPAAKELIHLTKEQFLALGIPGIVAAAKAWIVVGESIVKNQVPDLADAETLT